MIENNTWMKIMNFYNPKIKGALNKLTLKLSPLSLSLSLCLGINYRPGIRQKLYIVEMYNLL